MANATRGNRKELRGRKKAVVNIILYAPEDQRHLERLSLHLQDAQGVEIGDTAEAVLTDQPIHSVILLMSIDLLHRLVCETAYRALYRRLRLLEREGVTVIAYVRACEFSDHGHRVQGCFHQRDQLLQRDPWQRRRPSIRRSPRC